MAPESSSGDWEFAAAIGLIRSTSLTPPRRRKPQSLSHGPETCLNIVKVSSGRYEVHESTSLGNFEGVFQSLGLDVKSQPASELSLSLTSKSYPANRPSPTEAEYAYSITDELSTRPMGMCAESGSVDTGTAICLDSKEPSFEQHETDDEAQFNSNRDEQRSLLNLRPSTLSKDAGTLLRTEIIHDFIGTSLKADRKARNLYNKPPLTPASVGPLRSQPLSKYYHKMSMLQTGPEKLTRLMALLLARFPQDLDYLSTLPPILNVPRAQAETDIHVFVDVSNILIGFHDALKSRRGISKSAHIPRAILSFYRLSLILERGRLTEKRIVVGSDYLESIVEAGVIGYTTHILERVLKVKEPTSRQKYFKRIQAASGASSGSDDNLSRRVRKVEQGVDELLHLKMSHSLLDSAKPSTIVLATGDAAEAEYSDGFLRMVERALERGWKVELVAFKDNISRAYKRPDWALKWGDSFTIIELDEYAELIHLDIQEVIP